MLMDSRDHFSIFGKAFDGAERTTVNTRDENSVIKGKMISAFEITRLLGSRHFVLVPFIETPQLSHILDMNGNEVKPGSPQFL